MLYSFKKEKKKKPVERTIGLVIFQKQGRELIISRQWIGKQIGTNIWLSVLGCHDENSNSSLGQANLEELYVDQLPKVSVSLESMHLAGKVTECQNVKDAEENKTMVTRKEKSGAEPIIVPIVLKMPEFDHKALLEEWISTRTFGGKCLIEDKDRLIANLKTIQDYLSSFTTQGLIVVNVAATTFPQTLDHLHNHLLECIEKGISSSSSTNGRQSVEK